MTSPSSCSDPHDGRTMDRSSLLSDYWSNGVIHVRGLLGAQELQAARGAIERYQREILPGLPTADYTLEPDGRSVRNLWRMEQHDPYFADLAVRPTLLSLVEPLLNGRPVLLGVETFSKPALVGSAVPPHQDNAYFCQTPADVLTVWIALDAATRDNGAVEYLLGSHRELLPHAPSGVKGNSIGLAEVPADGQYTRFLGVISPGDALVHHSQTIHFSDANRSDQSRLSLILVYRGQHTQTDPVLKDSYNRAIKLTPQNA